MASRAPSSRQIEFEERLAVRIAELELRLKLLEARVRSLASEERRKVSEVAGQRAKGSKVERMRERPRCPGCLLEIPQGRRRDSCVWCGFRFEAVKARASR